MAETLRSDTDTFFNTTWNRRTGQVVPGTDDVALKNGAVDLKAVFLYSDIAHSTQLARKLAHSVAAKVVRAYLSSMTKLIRHHGGAVRSFDGDRVMGVFVGGSKNSSAAKCALRMNWMLIKVLRPKAEAKFPSLKQKGFVLTHCVGIHGGDVLVTRAGVRGSNDLVFIGSPPNIAAKLSEIRNGNYRSYMTWPVHDNLNRAARISSDGSRYWERTTVSIAGEDWTCYRSSWWWGP